MTKLPFDIRVVQEGLDATRFILPIRQLGKARGPLGGAMLGFGLLATVFMVFWMSGPIRSALGETGVGRWLGIGFGLLGLPGLVIGLALVAAGVLVLLSRSHTEILITADDVTAVERLGPARWRWRRPVTGIVRVVVQKGLGTSSTNGGPERPFGENLGSLLIESASGTKPLWVAPGYPHDMLRPLASELAKRFGATADSRELVPLRRGVGVVERSAGEAIPDDETPRPTGTDITVQEHAHGVAIEVPPAGLRKGSHGLFAFSLLWTALVGAMLVMVVVGAVRGRGDTPMGVFVFIAAFLAIGVAMMVAAINAGRRRVLLAVAGNTLAYRVAGLFRTTERQVGGEQIRGISVGPSGMEVNDRPVYELQILLAGRTAKIGLLSQRSRAEQEWVAAVLRRALNVGRG